MAIIVSMVNLVVNQSASIDKITTSVQIRMGTKHRLLDISRKGESYDDVISRLINTILKQEREIERLRKTLEELDALTMNRMEVFKIERGIGAVSLADGSQLVFSYNKPPENEFLDSYVLDIIIDKVTKGRKELEIDDVVETEYDAAMLQLGIIARIINIHFDPAFILPSRAMIIDPVFWKNACDRTGLPMSVYNSDILRIISGYERGMNKDGSKS